ALRHEPSTFEQEPGIPGGSRKTPGRLGEYDLLERVGGGGMGEVYRARHRRLGKVVAVKVLARHRSLSHEARSRFLREMEALGQLDHPNVVGALAAREADAAAFLPIR